MYQSTDWLWKRGGGGGKVSKHPAYNAIEANLLFNYTLLGHE